MKTKKRFFGILLSLMLVLVLLPVMSATAGEILPVYYLNASGPAQPCTTYTEVTNSTTTWDTGWYVVSSNVTCGNIDARGKTVHLILCDEATLSASSIDISDGGTMTVYAGSTGEAIQGTGALTVNAQWNAVSAMNGEFTMNGGVVNLSSQYKVFNDGGTIAINGGSFTAFSTGDGVFDEYQATVSVASGLTVMAGDSETTAVDVTDTFAGSHGQKWVHIDKAVTKYPLWVGGMQVIGANKDDVFGDGKVKYTPATDSTPATLTLNNYTYTGIGYKEGKTDEACSAIYYADDDPLTIQLSGANSITRTGKSDSHYGDSCYYGIHSTKCAGLTITGSSGAGLSVTCEGDKSSAIYAKSATLTIQGVSLTAATSANSGNSSITCGLVKMIQGASLTATGGYNGIYAGVEIGENSSVIAVGNGKAINGTVKNSIAGTGWTNTAGDEGKADIAVSTDGQTLTFKKVQFPAAADPVASVTSGSTTTEYTDFDNAVTAWDTAGAGATLKLLADVEINTSIQVKKGYGNPMILDLNGYGICFNDASAYSGSVIYINDGGNLKLKDSEPTRTHSSSPANVTGGYLTGGIGYGSDSRFGGGIYSFGSLTMEGGTIVGNTAKQGGGVYVGGTSPFKMTGGTISGNKANTNGGGVYVNSGASFNMTGGTISGNTAIKYGGGVFNYREFTMSGNSTIINNKVTGSDGKGGGVSSSGINGKFTMNGGIIQGNEAAYYAGVRIDGGTFTMTDGEISGNKASAGIGGVYAFNCTFTMTGGKIVNNEAASSCGGVYVLAPFNLSGGAVIKDNLMGSEKSNVLVNDGKMITVTGALSDTASIGVTMETPGVFTNSETTDYNVAARFSSDDADYAVIKNSSDQLELVPSYTVTYKVVGGTWSDDSTADKTENVASGSKPANVPTGMKASEGYTGGVWDTNPAEATITKATTFTYTFTAKQPATVTKAPTAKDLTYTGAAQELINAGSTEDGTMKYAVTTENKEPAADAYTFDNTSIPSKTDAGTYYVWYKAAGDANHNDSEPGHVTVVIRAKISATVTFEVKNGAWDDGKTEAKTVTLSGWEGDTLALTAADIPAAGTKPGDGYKEGGWEVAPVAGTAVSKDTTYTYIYAAKDSVVRKVTFKVVNGSWDDGNAADITVTLEGLEGDVLKLPADKIPSAGKKPAETYKAGAWDKVPDTETAITADTTYTYTYAEKDPISATVTFKVVNGSWDDGTTEDLKVTLAGFEGDSLYLAVDDVPDVGNKPAEGYAANGKWDTEPSVTDAESELVSGDPITKDTTYTYTYEKLPEPEPEPDPDKEINGFVIRLYKVMLGREPDPEGLKGWTEALKSGKVSAAEIVRGFARSEEFILKYQTNAAIVRALYLAMLDREPDPEGLDAWANVLATNPVEAVIKGLCGSVEFGAICKKYGIEPGTVDVPSVETESAKRIKIEAFVKRCYYIILSRLPDEDGLKGWSDALQDHSAHAARIIEGFVCSDEFMNKKLSNEAIVKVLYRTMLDRTADEEGLKGWTKALDDGYKIQHIINGFCGSVEFTKLCETYGILPGSVAVGGVMAKRETITPEGEEEAAAVVVVQSEYTNEEKVRAFVEHCYVSVFGREGDAEGIENYTALILDGKKTPKSVAREFVFSAEFQENLPGNEEFIRILYKVYCYREPGAEEVAPWAEMLGKGATLDEIVNGFAGSDEFRAIVNGMKE